MEERIAAKRAVEALREVEGIPYHRSTFWDADHIVPVIEGGGECDLDNYRTLCIPCHKLETAELRKRLAARRRAEKPKVQASIFDAESAA